MSADSRVVATVLQQPRELAVMSARQLLDRRETVNQIIDQVMVEGVHYGSIPGTPGVSLLKEGAEVLLATFGIAVEPVVKDLSTATEARFQVECRGLVNGDRYVGSGMGVCTSNEEKYRWRRVKSRQEWEDTPEDRRKLKYTRDGSEQVVRQSPHDVSQTVMSMAKKRAMVDLAKTALAASECLKRAKMRHPPVAKKDPGGHVAANHSMTPAGNSQPGQQREPKADPKAQGAAPATKAPETISAAQARTLYERLDHLGLAETAFLARFEIGALDELPAKQFDAAQNWLNAQSEEPGF